MSPSTALIQVDLDNTWAIAECYGIPLPEELQNSIYGDALPRLLGIFSELDINATFFAAGRDAELPGNAATLRGALAKGHEIASHSHTHPLNFRNLDDPAIEHEVARAEESIYKAIGQKPAGFRAPGYAVSSALLKVLARRGYRYDSSIMPSPFGFAFRVMDAWLRRGAGAAPKAKKTQFPLFRDALAPLSPYRVNPDQPVRQLASGNLIEIPVAASPLLRMPFQAGVCLSMGSEYFRVQLSAFLKRSTLPVVFLIHGADAADFSRFTDPFFRRAPVFSMPLSRRIKSLRFFLQQIRSTCDSLTSLNYVRSRYD